MKHVPGNISEIIKPPSSFHSENYSPKPYQNKLTPCSVLRREIYTAVLETRLTL